MCCLLYVYEFQMLDMCISDFLLLLQFLKCWILYFYGFMKFNFENLPTGGMETYS